MGNFAISFVGFLGGGSEEVVLVPSFPVIPVPEARVGAVSLDLNGPVQGQAESRHSGNAC